MLSIRLMRTGKIHEPHYRIVVQEKRSKLNGNAIDTIGHYHPAQAGKVLVIDKEKAAKWLKQGAQPSDTVTNLFVKEGILDKTQKVHNFFTPTKVEEKVAAPKEEVVAEAVTPEEEPAEETEAPTEEITEETPAEEAPEEVVEETTEAAADETEAAA